MNSRPTVRFVADLFETGRIVLDGDECASARDVAAMSQALVEFEQAYRKALPHEPPGLSAEAAAWAGGMLYRACQFLVYREHGEQAINEELSVTCPQEQSPSVCYSVDLTFRFLPDLVRLARAAAENDPLVKQLLHWAGDWPLSSVGIKGVETVDVASFIDDPCLRTMYVDRIIAQTDVSQLSDDRVQDAVREAVGAFPELAPALRSLLSPEEPAVTT